MMQRRNVGEDCGPILRSRFFAAAFFLLLLRLQVRGAINSARNTRF